MTSNDHQSLFGNRQHQKQISLTNTSSTSQEAGSPPCWREWGEALQSASGRKRACLQVWRELLQGMERALTIPTKPILLLRRIQAARLATAATAAPASCTSGRSCCRSIGCRRPSPCCQLVQAAVHRSKGRLRGQAQGQGRAKVRRCRPCRRRRWLAPPCPYTLLLLLLLKRAHDCHPVLVLLLEPQHGRQRRRQRQHPSVGERGRAGGRATKAGQVVAAAGAIQGPHWKCWVRGLAVCPGQ